MRSLIAGAALLALMIPAAACDLPMHTMDQDKAIAERDGFDYLGPHRMPYTDAQSLFYAKGGVLFVSPIMPDGCVPPIAFTVGPYLPEQGI